jgi:hypothetical protein
MVIGARKREVGMSVLGRGHALASIAGARAIILDASRSRDLGQAAVGGAYRQGRLSRRRVCVPAEVRCPAARRPDSA